MVFETTFSICFTLSLHEFSVPLMFLIIYYFLHFSCDTDESYKKLIISYELGLRYDRKNVKIVTVSKYITQGVLYNKAYFIQ